MSQKSAGEKKKKKPGRLEQCANWGMMLSVAAGKDLFPVLPGNVPVLYRWEDKTSRFREGEEVNQSCYPCALSIFSGKLEQKGAALNVSLGVKWKRCVETLQTLCGGEAAMEDLDRQSVI